MVKRKHVPELRRGKQRSGEWLRSLIERMRRRKGATSCLVDARGEEEAAVFRDVARQEQVAFYGEMRTEATVRMHDPCGCGNHNHWRHVSLFRVELALERPRVPVLPDVLQDVVYQYLT